MRPRRDLVVENTATLFPSSVGATLALVGRASARAGSSVASPHRICRSGRSLGLNGCARYKDPAPTVLMARPCNCQRQASHTRFPRRRSGACRPRRAFAAPHCCSEWSAFCESPSGRCFSAVRRLRPRRRAAASAGRRPPLTPFPIPLSALCQIAATLWRAAFTPLHRPHTQTTSQNPNVSILRELKRAEARAPFVAVGRARHSVRAVVRIPMRRAGD